MRYVGRILAGLCCFGTAFQSSLARQPAATPSPATLKFDFGSGPIAQGHIRITPTMVYSDEAGYGYELGAHVLFGDGGSTTTSDAPFLFSVKAEEGNYRVTVAFGDSETATTTTIKAESGRLMAERVKVPAGQVIERSFLVNVRTRQLPRLPVNAPGREEVSLDQFDLANARDWDNRLTIEIESPRAALRSIEVTSAPGTPTIYLAGDSTVTDRDASNVVSWGQLLPKFFTDGIAVSNDAQSGETLKSFANALRLDKILSRMKKGDYLLIQFATNDSKLDWPQTYVDPETTYKAYLRVYIAEARLRGAIPILVTSMDHGLKGNGLPAHGLGKYPQAMREMAQSEHVPLIDLYEMSQTLYQSAGSDAPKILVDGTHSSAYGGYEFAKCIVTAIRQEKLDLARYIAPDFSDFNPAAPDSANALKLDELFHQGPPMPWETRSSH